MKILLVISSFLLASAAIAMPSWQELEFEQRAWWLTVRSSVQLAPTDGSDWDLTVSSSGGTSEESVHISFDPVTGATRGHERFSRGKEQRYKRHRFDDSGKSGKAITRERYEPGPEAAPSPVDGWKLVSRRSLPYPRLPMGTVLASPYTLLALAEQALDLPGRTLQVYVFTDLNTYLVELSAAAEESVAVDYNITGSKQPERGEADAIMIKISAEPWGKLADKPDFNLLGLTGNINLLLDKQTRLPLELRGRAPRVGQTVLKLKSASLRDPDQ